MTILDDLYSARECLDALSSGRNPRTGRDMSSVPLRDPVVAMSLTNIRRLVDNAIADKESLAGSNKKEELEKLTAQITVSAQDSAKAQYVPRIQALEKQLAKVQAQVEKGSALLAERDSTIAGLQEQITTLKTQLASEQNRVKTLSSAAQTADVQTQDDKGKHATKAKPATEHKPVERAPRRVPPAAQDEYYLIIRNKEANVTIIHDKITLNDFYANINTAFDSATNMVSSSKIINLLKDWGLLTVGKVANQSRLLMPTQLGEFYGFSLAPVVEDGAQKMQTVLNDRAQVAILNLINEGKMIKQPFAYYNDLIKCIPLTSDEISLSKIVERINEIYSLENMTKLTFDMATAVLVHRGVLIPNPDGDRPKYVPNGDMKKNGVLFYPADDRFPAKTLFNTAGQKFVLRELAWLNEK